MISLTEFNPWDIVMISALNPLVILVAIAMGRDADQWQKVVVAAFAASIVGIVGVWIVTYLGFLHASGFGGTSGIFTLQTVFGLFWAGAAYFLAQRQRPS